MEPEEDHAIGDLEDKLDPQNENTYKGSKAMRQSLYEKDTPQFPILPDPQDFEARGDRNGADDKLSMMPDGYNQLNRSAELED